MEYVIGVDAGGTKTEAIAYDLRGHELIKTVTGFGNLVLNEKEAINNILDSIKTCIDKLSKEGLKKIYIGAAGIEVANNAYIIEKNIKENFNTDVMVINDGELALKAVLKGEDGVLTIAGTGSICIGIRNNIKDKCGGWGHLLGDEGSGYSIAIKALRRMIHEQELNLERSRLHKEILKELNITNTDEICAFVYSSTKDKIASLTKLISKLAEEGEENAIAILKKEGKALGVITERVYKRLNFENKCSIGIKGSVIEKAKVLRQAFQEYLLSNIGEIKIVQEDESSAKGAYYMYLKEI
ncbi:ATPase [Clostridium botulinum]|uniref:ATPase n=2 Tax=Clostridium botulinum TaxID=1491 RepID=A0A846HWM6_CLOBO|nr:BadF/BadG/BcrA/BcrD ATPase family protein [Clostridium botulinum]ACQ54570.1 BadF/BadG/BcrA/BcrD ATPase family protein [Clostridium botulinum Ba4 str. 657]AJE09433.1 badF/BadG/BcrA/BcrD ATPase family protein [Clostridium botulinum CDC_1436]AXG93056.1 ATPase [Clostridium botulinum]EDT86699.1 BadF/BadG/BcrA/BcrD ATPase family protein [Clostridium botulinum Bf]MBY6757970.1 ATPase [Clostridium botulinum]